MRTIKVLAVLVALGLAALAGYAYLGDMRPDQREIERPLTLPAPAPQGG
ncbi:MAG: hypothetical protein ACK4KW_04895 [Gemmobacter sp.]